MIPYGRQTIDEADIAAVVEVLRSDWLTQGPKVAEFEEALAAYCGARYAVAVANGTAALHAAFVAAGIGPGNEFITSPITFPATSNVGLWQGARPVFVDIDPATGNIDPTGIEPAITKKTKAIVPIDYTGRPVNLSAIRAIAEEHGLPVIEDACQALGAEFGKYKIGSRSAYTVFSFHPVKSITTGEGGAILTNDERAYRLMKRFITHGVERQRFSSAPPGEWYFEMQLLGQNYRLTDIQSALGLSQLKKLDVFIAARREIANRYTRALADLPFIATPPADTDECRSAWHLYVIRVRAGLAGKRDEAFRRLRAAGIGVNLHHIPVYLHPYYRQLGFAPGLCPRAERFYEEIISLPLYPTLSLSDQKRVIDAVRGLGEFL
ncbi:MAG: UDP-4-amino-4,6-dideoxy-N-acetyl-beta-L-altrosamine transaminase [Candidatus Magasanikbacteria bacterium]|nr:UDP-4-amino-4,6-dideoxy-N-acetyl-beta-L-altrosamine transaminase [Candidatus Magasanikbacteria bacterium]